MSDGPHPAIRVLTVMVGAGVIGATLAGLGAPPTIGGFLIGSAIVLLVLAGIGGVLKGEPVLGALAGLGLLLLVEALQEIGLFLFLGSIGFVLASLAMVAGEFWRKRREADPA